MGPFKCPDCEVWWAGFEHRCKLDLSRIRIAQDTNTVTWSGKAVCSCPPNRGDNYAGNCPIHDVQTTMTV